MNFYKLVFAATFVFVVFVLQVIGAQSSNRFSFLESKLFSFGGGSLKSPDKGDFKIGFAPEKGKQRASKMDADIALSFQDLADGLNETFALPADVYIAVAECGESNAFYESGKRQITMCYELYDELDEVFKTEFTKKAERDDAVSSAFVFIFFHELGHAFVDVYDLPVAGREEDAVDALSTWILTDGTDAGDGTALNGAIAFALLGDGAETTEDLPFWDEHSLSSQRFYNVVCWIYGQNPQRHKDFVKNGVLPKSRAGRCTDEYAKIDRTWQKLLSPFVKQ